MRAEDAPAAAAAGRIAIETLYPDEFPAAETDLRVRWSVARAAHLQETDPEGCWVAEVDGQVVGVALGLIREGVWGFSLFGLLPAFQGLGIGGPLYTRALAYGAHAERGGLIMSSSHPAAMGSYARSPGFRLVPTIRLAGVCRRDRAPSTSRCRPGDVEADAATLDRASRHARGASHRRDLPSYLAFPDRKLLVVEGEGFVIARDGSPALLAATNEAAAQELLWGAMLSGPEAGRVSLDAITGANQWAVRTGLEAGLALELEGPLYVRGRPGALAPYIPSGAYL